MTGSSWKGLSGDQPKYLRCQGFNVRLSPRYPYRNAKLETPYINCIGLDVILKREVGIMSVNVVLWFVER